MFGIEELSFDFLTGLPLITALVFILFILFTLYVYRRTNPPLATGSRALLAGLRLFALAALFLVLFEPVVSYQRRFERKPRLTVLVDRSASMRISENGQSRLRGVEQFLDSEKFNDFADNFDVDFKSFADIVSSDPDSLDVQKTALGEVLNRQGDVEMGQPAEAWILLTDGISNFGMAPTTGARNLNSPVFSIGIGQDSLEKDIGIVRLDYNQIVYAGKQTTIKIEIDWQGMNNEKASLRVKEGAKILTTKQVTLTAGDLRDEVEIKFTPEKTGQQTFEVDIEPLAGEVSTDNNHRAFALTVLKSKLNVLLVADYPDWEYAFLKRFLDKSESVELTSIVYSKEGGYLTGEMPSRQEEINRFDLIIMYDINIDKLKSRQNLVKSFLEDKGGGMLVLLGENYMKARFPRWLDDYLPFISRRKGKPLDINFSGLPIENYLFHPAVRISDSRQDIRQAWQRLPYFEALIPVDSIPAGSEALVMAELGSPDARQPIIGLRRIGAGRVLATAAAPFWHWAFFGYGFGEDDRQYRRFFDGLVNWLAVREDSDPVKIIPDNNVFTRGERVGFTAMVYDLGFRPIGGATGQVALVSENGRDSIIAQFTETGEGRYRAEYDFVPSGVYRYSGLVEKDGRKIKEAEGQIAIESFSLEEFRRRPDFENLMNISRSTGGEFFSLVNTDSLFQRIDTDRIMVVTNYEFTLWNKFWLLVIFIAALGAEWFLRKRWQLI